MDRRLTGADRDFGIQAIVGPNGPKDEVDDVEVATVTA